VAIRRVNVTFACDLVRGARFESQTGFVTISGDKNPAIGGLVCNAVEHRLRVGELTLVDEFAQADPQQNLA
jgi:hypothetical protein